MQLAGKLHFEMLLGLSLRGLSAVASFGITWVIAQSYGADTVGLYQLGMATMLLVSLGASLGLDILLVREVGAMLREGREGDARATYLQSRKIVLLYGIALAVAVVALSVPFARFVLDQPRAVPFLVLLAPVVVLLPLMKLTTALLRTVGKVFASQSLEGVSYSSLTLAGLALAALAGWTGFNLLPAILYPLAMAGSVALAWHLAARVVGAWPQGRASVDARSGLPIVAPPLVTQAGDWIMLLFITAMVGIAETGIYRTAFQICLLFQLVNASFAMMAGPHLSRAAAGGETRKLTRIIAVAGGVGLAVTLPLTIVGLVVPEFVLGLFGPEFREGAQALQILVIGQVINVGFGPVGTALVMMRREKLVLAIELFASLAGVATAALLIGGMGMAGAATGAMVAFAIRNGGNFIALRRVTGSGAASGG